MTPRLQGEIDKGLDKMRRHQYDAARAQFEKAAKMAPGNPDVQYLLGMVEYAQEHFEAARTKFETALAIYPAIARRTSTSNGRSGRGDADSREGIPVEWRGLANALVARERV
jgi:tetratricopeptide (TPR) repeat protein